MTCPECKTLFTQAIKKHQVVTCKCGARLMLIEIKKENILVKV